jgi:hypothetical protein
MNTGSNAGSGGAMNPGDTSGDSVHISSGDDPGGTGEEPGGHTGKDLASPVASCIRITRIAIMYLLHACVPMIIIPALPMVHH